jgi:hypothetical protein
MSRLGQVEKAWLVGVAMLAFGCADPEPDPCSHRVCDVDELECIEQVAVTVACKLGESEVIVPVVRFVTADELTAEIEAEVALDQPTPEQIEALTDYYLGEALVGLMPDTYEYAPPALDIAKWAGAFYSIDNDEVVVITDNFDSSDREQAYLVLVHEMIHVYQDQSRDLEALNETYATSFDRFLGLRAIIEGEAEYYKSLAEIELLGWTPDEVDWLGYFAAFRTNVLAAAAESEAPSQQAVGLFPYPYGAEFIYEAYQARAGDSIDAVFEAPPDSVRQVVGGHAEWPDSLVNRDDVLNAHAVPIFPDRYTYIGGRHQSVWLLNTMLQRTAGYEGEWGSWVLDGVSADYFSVHRDEQSQALVGVWRIRTGDLNAWSNALAAAGSRWRDAGSSDPETHVFTTVDGDLVLVATTGPDGLLVLADINGWQSLEAMQADPGVTRMRSQHEILATR